MTRTTDLLLIVLVAGAAWYIWQNKEPTSQAQVQQAFYNAGFEDVRTSSIPGDADATFLNLGNSTARFAPGDFDKLNLAQRILIGVDRFIPGTALTRAVLS